ncbi:MAG: hypothetical protein AAGI03_16970 [Pseudomonadota bacterium]
MSDRTVLQQHLAFLSLSIAEAARVMGHIRVPESMTAIDLEGRPIFTVPGVKTALEQHGYTVLERQDSLRSDSRKWLEIVWKDLPRAA